jgi:hypothetical protein
LWTGRTKYTRIFILIVAASRFIVAVVLAIGLTTIAKVIGTSRKRIFFAHKIISFIDFGEAPLHYMLFFDKQIQSLLVKKGRNVIF